MEKGKKVKAVMSSQATIKEYFAGCSLSALTLKEYIRDVQQYLDFTALSGARECADSLKAYFDSLVNRKLSPGTIRRKLYAIKKYIFSKYGNDLKKRSVLEQVFKAPELKKANVKAQKEITEDDYISREEIESLAEQAPEKLGLIMLSLFWTGCRISELLSITLDRVKLNGKASIKVIGKGNKERTVFLPLDLYDTIIKVYEHKKNKNPKRF